MDVSKLKPIKSSGITKPGAFETVNETGAPARAGIQARQI
jgi:hypothetical protein